MKQPIGKKTIKEKQMGFWRKLVLVFWRNEMNKGGKGRKGRGQQKTCILKANPNLNPVPKH
jgi:hypothetical protein